MVRRAISWAFRSGVRKGVVGGSGPWLFVAVAAGAIKVLNRAPKGAGGRTTLTLSPGDQYSIVCADEPTRR